MTFLFIPAVVALAIALLATPVCRTASRRFGWLDHPDSRKLHTVPIPRVGGIAIFVAYAAAASMQHAWTILPAVFVAFGTGLLDDILNLKPRMKIAGQILAAVLVCAAGIQIPGGGVWWWRVALTLIWLVGCANAVNLIDGVDGLAAGIGLVATAAAFFSALLTGNAALAVVTAPLLGALAGFLLYNFNPASIFMGDCGSNTVGFLLGCYAVMWSQGCPTPSGLASPVVALAIPVLDTSLAIFRRFLHKEPIFAADRGHIHHRLLARGFAPRHVALVLYAAAGFFACLSLLLTTGTYNGGLVLSAFCVAIWLALRYLRYDEFDSVRRVCFSGLLRNSLSADLVLSQFEAAIRSADTIDQCWFALLSASQNLGLSRTSMQVFGRTLTAQFAGPETFAACSLLHVPLDGAGTIDLEIPSGPAPAALALLTTSLRTVLAPKLAALRPQLAFTAAAGHRR